MQDGRDAYDKNKRLDLDHLQFYDVDHIIPRNLIKDNSFDNKVLTTKVSNEWRKSGDEFASETFPEMLPLWQTWVDTGLISKRKFDNLTMRKENVDKYKPGFIARQLVETRQIIKLTQQVLQQLLPADSKIINIKANLSHEFREAFDFPKIRQVNDYHHAFDAHLAAFLGTYLRREYPQLGRYFEYGNFLPIPKHTLSQTNFIGRLKGKHGEKIANEDGEVTWSREDDIKELIRIYDFKIMNVSYEAYEDHGALYNQTLYKAKDAPVNGGKRKTMIPAKMNRPIELYGGYTGSRPAYLAIARIEKKSGPIFKVLAVNVGMASIVEKLSKAEASAKLHKLLADQFKTVSKNGEVKESVFRIIMPRVKLGSLFYNSERGYFRLMSSSEYRSSVQLFMSREEQLLLAAKAGSVEKEKLLTLFDSIIDRVTKYNLLYKDKVRALPKLRSTIMELSLADLKEGTKTVIGIRSTIIQLLAAFHASANIENMKAIGGPSDLGRVFNPSGISLEADSRLVSLSPAGLFTQQSEINKY